MEQNSQGRVITREYGARNYGPRDCGPLIVRQPSFVDKAIATAAVFVQRLVKQMIITLGVSSLRAMADWLLKSGDDKVNDVLKTNMGPSSAPSTEARNRLYGNNGGYADSYYDRYNSQYHRDGRESFPGFH